jgi:hypothetical protein
MLKGEDVEWEREGRCVVKCGVMVVGGRRSDRSCGGGGQYEG